MLKLGGRTQGVEVPLPPLKNFTIPTIFTGTPKSTYNQNYQTPVYLGTIDEKI